MNRRLSIILFCAFLVATLCSYGVYRVAAAQISRANGTRIAFAARDLPTGSLIHEGDVTFGQWVGTLPAGAITDRRGVLERGVVSMLYKGEPILQSRLALPGTGGGLGAIIRSGMRACAVKVDEVVGVAGFVIPGQRVDVLIAGNAPGTPANDGPKVRTLLQNIEVLSAGTNIQRDAEGKPVQVQVVNLLVTPEQAEALSLASSVTRIQLVLRNPLDNNLSKPPELAMATLFSDGAPKPPVAPKPHPVARVEKPAPPRVYLIQVLNGAKKTEEKFNASAAEQPPPQQDHP